MAARSLAFARWAVAILLLSLPGLTHAQLDTGTIGGTVRDSSGAVVARANVRVINVGTGQDFQVTASDLGEFIVTSLPAGTYAIEVSLTGFKTAIVYGVNLHASETRTSDVTLDLGEVSERVTVTAQAATVDTLSSDLSLTVDTKRVDELPLNGRDFTSLIALVPGSVTSAGLFQTSLGGFDTSIIGTGVLLDGTDATRIDTNSISTQLGRQESRITRASVDSISEFRVIQGNYSAEYGRSVGNIINVITKSGTNEFHGDAFEFFRNDAFDAKNFFASPGFPTPLRLNQFGGSVAGPIKRDKLFFFTNYEGVRQSITNSEQFHVLDAAERSKFVASLQPVLNAIPQGNGGPFIDPQGHATIFDVLNANLRSTLREDTGSVKLDYNATEKNRFSLRYNVNDSETITQYGPATGQTAPDDARSQFFKLNWTLFASSSLVNQAGFAINKESVNDLGGGAGFPAFACFFCDFGDAPGPDLFSQISPQTSTQFMDTLSKSLGRHTISTGFDTRWNRSDRALLPQTQLTYGSVSDFENNNGFAIATLGYPLTKVRNTNYAFFVQDDFRVYHNLTLNLGVRYEYNSVLHSVGNTIQNFDIATQTLMPAGQDLYAPDRNNFAPRVGFSWDVTGASKTVVRGGFGIFYNPQLTGSVLSLAGNNVTNLNVNVFQLLFGTVNCTPALSLSYPVQSPLPNCTPFAPYNVNEIDPKMRDTYAEHWNLGVQRQLARNTVLAVDYVGNHGLKLPAGAGYAGQELNPIINNATGNRALTQAYADERLLGDYLHSRYDGLQVALRHHSGRLAFDANYTYSHEYDNTPNIFSGFQNNAVPNADYSTGDIDVRHNFTADALYDLPSWNRLGKRLGSGWEVGTLVNVRSGLPVNIVTGANVFSDVQNRPDLVAGQTIRPSNYSAPNNQLNINAFATPAAGPNAFGNLGRNAAVGPGFTQFDFSTIKNTELAEHLKLQFRAEMFNIFNHPNFANPVGNLSSSQFGESTSTIGNLVGIGTSRQVQFALRLLF